MFLTEVKLAAMAEGIKFRLLSIGEETCPLEIVSTISQQESDELEVGL